MARVKYVGIFDAVEVPSLGLVAKRGVAVDVADDAVEGLLEQTDNWQPVKGKGA